MELNPLINAGAGELAALADEAESRRSRDE